MAVQKVTEVFSAGATLNESAQKEFEVLFTDLGNQIAACTATDGTTTIPSPGDQFDDTYTTYVAQKPIARRIGKSGLFRVIVPYAINDSSFGGNKAISPLSRPTEWSSDGIPSTITVDRDAAGNLIKNSAKQVMSVQIQHADKYISAVKNYASMQNFDAYFNRTNSASYTIEGQAYGIETLWLSHVSQPRVEEEYDGDVIEYWQATFHFYAKIKRGTDEPTKSWRFKILDRGTVKTDAAAPDGFSAIKDDDAIITAETNLDGAGAVWNGTTPYFLNGAAAFAVANVANDYTTMFQTADFNALGL